MGTERNGVVEFDSFRIELENRLLLKNGEVVALAPKTFDLLAALVENRGTVLDKETLFRKVWPDVFVEESSLTKNISLLRRCLGDDPDGRAYIQTLPRRGYRFQASLGQVRTRPVEDTILEEETTEVVIESEESATRFSRAKWLLGAVAVLAGAVVLLAWIMGRNVSPTIGIRSIAILPFRTLGGPEYLADGITEELTVRLSRIASLRVISPQVAMRLKNVTGDPRDIGRQLATDSVLVGAVRTGEGEIRVSAQLLSVKDGSVIWADAGSDERLVDLLGAERRVASSLVERLQLRMTPGERSAVERLATRNGDAYESVLRGKSLFAASRRAARITNNRTTELFRRAILLDPSYADAYSWLAVSLSGPFQPSEAHQAAAAYAQKALDLDPDQVVARRALIELSDEMGNHRAGLAHAKRVFEIAPRDPQALLAAAKAYFRTGIADRAIALLEEAVRIDPEFDEGRAELASVLNSSGHPLRALDVIKLLAQPNEGRWLMTAYSESGNLAKALETAREYRPLAGHPTGWLTRGIVLEACGKPEEARQTWIEGAAQAEAELRLEDEYRKRAMLALMCARLGRAADAREHMRRALALNPGHPWTLFFAGEMEALLGNREATLSYVRQAVERDWLQLQFFDYYQRPHHGFYAVRNDPQFRALRNEVARRVEELRKRF